MMGGEGTERRGGERRKRKGGEGEGKEEYCPLGWSSRIA